jgi:hypothetical protein
MHFDAVMDEQPADPLVLVVFPFVCYEFECSYLRHHSGPPADPVLC